jgi:hypothetical protein
MPVMGWDIFKKLEKSNKSNTSLKIITSLVVMMKLSLSNSRMGSMTMFIAIQKNRVSA